MGQSEHYYSPSFLILYLHRFNNRNCFDSYDTRGAHAGTPSHWRDEEVLEDRAVFRTHKEPAELIINPVKVTHSLSSLRFPTAPRIASVNSAALYNWNFISGKGCGQLSVSRGLQAFADPQQQCQFGGCRCVSPEAKYVRKPIYFACLELPLIIDNGQILLINNKAL